MMAINIKTILTYTTNKNYLACIVALFFITIGFSQETAKKVNSPYFKNLYRVNDSVYRSEQPSKKGFQDLEQKGVKSVLNFRRNVKDDRKTKKTQLTLEYFPLKTSELTEELLVKALKIIQTSKKPILVHCWHGSDRTGAVIAAYRIVFENWTKEDAIRELRIEAFGYHENWYPNVINLLTDIDVNKIRQELKIK